MLHSRNSPTAPWRGTAQEDRIENQRDALAGVSMLHALEPAHRAVAGSSTRGPKRRKRTSARWRGTMLQALEPAHRALAEKSASGPKHRRGYERNLRAVAGLSMLRAVEAAHRAAVRKSASRTGAQENGPPRGGARAS